MKTLITGVSTRAIAESAVKSGYDVFTIDYFGDSDQKQIVKNYSLLRDFNLPFRAENLIEVSSRFEFDSVVYISNFENFPELLEKLPQHVRILGNSPQTLRKVRDWKVLRDFMTANNIPFPETLLPGEEEKVIGLKGWLLKPTNSGGGSRIKPWEGERLSENQVIQRYLNGIHASASFLSDGQESVLIGLSAQLIGLNELGATGFTWCGNILPLPLAKPAYLHVVKRLENYISLLSAHFKLKGACGIDFIITGENTKMPEPYIVEVNPRYTASMELVEEAYGLNVYSLHNMAFEGRLPVFSIEEQDDQPFYGKGIIFARKDIEIKNTEEWRNRGVKDIPFKGDIILEGHPVCSIMIKGKTHNECLSALFNKTELLRQEIGDVN
jgi:uncharacterized protein